MTLDHALIIEAFCVFGIGSVILSRFMSPLVSILLSLLKVSIPVIYFAAYYDGTWTFLDDITYFHQGKSLLELGYNPFAFFFNKHAVAYLMSLSGGHHILYGWWNFMSQYLFGVHYYSPVLLNVSLTFIGAYFIYNISLKVGFSKRYSRLLSVFFLLSPSLLFWSSFLNLKDILVLTLTIISFYYVISIVKDGVSYKKAIVLIAVSFVFYWIRFYVPVLILSSFASVPLLQSKRKFLKISVGILVIVAYVVYAKLYYRNFSQYLVGSLIYGPLRFLLTPRPWGIEKSYSFLLLPSIVNWLLFVPTLIGGYALAKEKKDVWPLLIYFVVTTLFYGLVVVVQGPRHRIGIEFILSWMQFHFLWELICGVKGERSYYRSYWNIGRMLRF